MATYYVSNASPVGSDSNDGLTTDTPWLTIAKLNATIFVAGDVINLNRGCSWRESLILPASGSSGNPITCQAYGVGANPILNGSRQFADFTLDSGAIWKRASSGLQAFENNVRLIKATSKVAMVAGSWFTDAGPNDYIWAADSGNPNTGHNIELSTGSVGACVVGNGKGWWVFDGIDTTKSQIAGYGFADHVDAHDIIIQNCTTSYSWRGVSTALANGNYSNITVRNVIAHSHISEAIHIGDGSGHVIDNVECYHTVNEYAKGYPTAGNGTGVNVAGGATCTIKNCYVHDIYFGPCYLIEFINSVRCTNITMKNNIAKLNVSLFSGVGTGYADQGGTGSIFHHNLCIGTTALTGRGADFSNGANGGAFYHNTFYGSFTNYCFGWRDCGVNNNFKNNIIYLTNATTIITVNATGLQGGVSDYNCFGPSVSATRIFNWAPDTTTQTTLAAWTAKSGQDAHSLSTDPLLLDPTNGNYLIGANSPVKDVGVVIAGINDGASGSALYSGAAPDMGYYELNLVTAQWVASEGATAMGATKNKARLTWVELGNPKETEIR